MGDDRREDEPQPPATPAAPEAPEPAPAPGPRREPPRVPVQRAASTEWSSLPSPPGPQPLGAPPLPDLQPLDARRAKPKKPLLRRLLVGVVQLIVLFLVGSVLWVAAYRFIPPPITLTMIGDVIQGRGLTKDWMPINQIDPSMARAAIAAEDSRFCSHSGFDFQAIEKAYERNAQGGHHIRGGSTISQQTAKNVFLWQGGGYFRKGLEAWFTFLIEKIWGKRRIMEVYLNVAETGVGTYGVNAGAQRYFHHDASHLSDAEAARIAAVLPLPKKRAAIAPTGFTRRYGNTIDRRIGVVAGGGLDACVR